MNKINILIKIRIKILYILFFKLLQIAQEFSSNVLLNKYLDHLITEDS